MRVCCSDVLLLDMLAPVGELTVCPSDHVLPCLHVLDMRLEIVAVRLLSVDLDSLTVSVGIWHRRHASDFRTIESISCLTGNI